MYSTILPVVLHVHYPMYSTEVLQYIYQYTTILPVVLLLAIMYVYRYGTVGIQY